MEKTFAEPCKNGIKTNDYDKVNKNKNKWQVANEMHTNYAPLRISLNYFHLRKENRARRQRSIKRKTDNIEEKNQICTMQTS